MLAFNRAGELVGIITEGDFLHRGEIGTEVKRRAWLDAFFGTEQSANDYVRAHGIKVKELMTGPPITVTEGTSLNQVVALMERNDTESNVYRLSMAQSWSASSAAQISCRLLPAFAVRTPNHRQLTKKYASAL